MDNKENPMDQFTRMSKDMAFPLFVDGGGKWAANRGLSKLEAFVMHNMPEIHLREGWAMKLTDREKAKIDKTIEACKYALEKLEEARGNE